MATRAGAADNDLVTVEEIQVIEEQLDRIERSVQRLRWSSLRRTDQAAVRQLRQARHQLETACQRCCPDEPMDPGDPALQPAISFLKERLRAIKGARSLLLYSASGGIRAIAIVDDEEARDQALSVYDAALDQFEDAGIDLVVHLTKDFQSPLDVVAAGASRAIDL